MRLLLTVPRDAPGLRFTPKITMRKLSIVLADDNSYFREQAIRYLRTQANVGEIWEARDGEEAYSLTTEKTPDAVLLDLSMPGVSGINVLPRLVGLDPPPVVIVVSGLSEESYRDEVERLGASAVVPKSRFLSDIPGVLKKVSDYRAN